MIDRADGSVAAPRAAAGFAGAACGGLRLAGACFAAGAVGAAGFAGGACALSVAAAAASAETNASAAHGIPSRDRARPWRKPQWRILEAPVGKGGGPFRPYK